MEVEVLQENLKKALSIVQKAIPTKPQLPILSSVLIEANKDKLVISSTDLYLGIKAKVVGKIIKTGKIALPGRLFYNSISSLDPGKISLVLNKDSLIIKSSNNKSVIQCFSAEEFPDFPNIEGEEFKIKPSVLREIKEKVSFCASTDLTRPVLTALLFSFSNGSLTTVGTDGFRLAILSQKSLGKKDQENFLLPAKAIEEVVGVFADQDEEQEVLFVFSSELKQVRFLVNGVEMYVRLIEGEFPPYQKIIPADFQIEVEVDGQDLEDQLKRAQVFARESSNIIRFNLSKKEMIVSASSPSYGKHEGKILINLKKGKGGEIAFNSRYLLDFISSLHPEKVLFYMNESLTPAMLRPSGDENYKYIIMPFRVNE
jgi:DNA polymerase-3 subunit beta